MALVKECWEINKPVTEEALEQWAYDENLELWSQDEDLFFFETRYVDFLLEKIADERCPKRDWILWILKHYVQHVFAQRDIKDAKVIFDKVQKYKSIDLELVTEIYKYISKLYEYLNALRFKRKDIFLIANLLQDCSTEKQKERQRNINGKEKVSVEVATDWNGYRKFEFEYSCFSLIYIDQKKGEWKLLNDKPK